MKSTLIILFTLCAAAATAQNTVVARVSQFENNRGICRACIFNSEAGFTASKPVACVQGNITNKTSEISFTNFPDGQYAIFIFHDVNGNNKMDKNFLGIPKEGYGASGNKLPFAAAPRFKDNAFTISGGVSKTLVIRLRNL